MNTRSKIFLLAAAVLLLATGAFAQHNQGQGQGQTCPHMTATSASLDKAVALLEKAKTDPASVDKALAEVRAAKTQVTQCQEMCQKGMCGSHAGMKGHGAHAGPGMAAAPAQPTAKKVTDPVCGMQIDPATAAAKSVYAGKTYYFCTKDEKAQFDKNPEKYVKKD